MWPNPLVPVLARRAEHAHVRVLDNLELVLLVGVKVLVKRAARQLDGLSDEAGKVHGDLAHALHVLGEHAPEAGEHLWRRPLVRRQ